MTALTSLPRARDGGRAVSVPPAVSGRQKAAIIVRLLLSEGGDLPLRNLPDHLQAALTEQIGSMRSGKTRLFE